MVDLPILASTAVSRSGPQSRLLVLLHGYGEPVDQLVDRLDLLDPDGRFCAVAPLAPFERKGRLIWHRALSARDEAEQQYLESLAAIDAHLGALEQELGLPASEAVVGGFSQGGGLGIGLLLAADVRHRPAAAFGVCSFPPVVRGFRVDRASAAGRPLFMSCARDDHFAPIDVSRAGAALLRDTGLDLTYAESEGGHQMTDAAAVQIGAWLDDLPAGGVPAVADGRMPNDLLHGVEGLDGYFDGNWVLIS